MNEHSPLRTLLRKKILTCERSLKKVFLEISQNSEKKHLGQSLLFNKVAGLRSATS